MVLFNNTENPTILKIIYQTEPRSGLCKRRRNISIVDLSETNMDWNYYQHVEMFNNMVSFYVKYDRIITSASGDKFPLQYNRYKSGLTATVHLIMLLVV